MASVQKYGSGYSVRYWYESETGERKLKRVSGFPQRKPPGLPPRSWSRSLPPGLT